MEFNQKSIENAFYSDGYKLGMKVGQSGIKPTVLYEAITEMYESIDTLISDLEEIAQNNHHPVNCKKGCEWCCHQPVFALMYEMDYLNHYIRNNFDDTEIEKIRKRAADKRNAFGFLTEEELLNAKFPCALLNKGACIAYEARPMACRIYLSSDVKSCLRFYHHPSDEKSIPALLNLPLRAGKMLNEGFKSALRMHGFVSEEFRIEEKILEF